MKLLTPEQVSQQLAVSRWTVLRMIMTVHYLPCACDRVGGKRSGECEKSAGQVDHRQGTGRKEPAVKEPAADL